MADLIERLRAFEGSDELGNGDFSLLSEAAATIEALRAEVAEWKGIAVAQSAEIERLRAEVSELRAARIAYASEFPETKDGGPDTGNIHTNIRSLKARAERLAEALRELVDVFSESGMYDEEVFDKARAALSMDGDPRLENKA